MAMNGDTVLQISELQERVEELKEELYATNIKYNSKIALEKDAVEEIEALQRNLDAEKINQSNLVLKFAEEAKQINKNWKNEIERLKGEHEEQTKNDFEKIQHLEEELVQCKKYAKAEVEKLSQTTQNLDMMTEMMAVEEEKREKAEMAAKILEDRLIEMDQKLAEVLQVKDAKEEEIESFKEKLMQAEEEVALYSSQLREVQGPLKEEGDSGLDDNSSSKGNSLFAEVDDRRQLMKQQLLVEKKKFLNLQRAYKSKCSQAQHMQSQLADVTRKWKDDAKDTITSQDSLITSLMSRIKDLEEEVKRVPRQVCEHCGEREFLGRKNREPLELYKYMESEVEREREQVTKLKEKLNERSIEKLLGDEEMYKLKADMRRLRAENAHLTRMGGEQKGIPRTEGFGI